MAIPKSTPPGTRIYVVEGDWEGYELEIMELELEQVTRDGYVRPRGYAVRHMDQCHLTRVEASHYAIAEYCGLIADVLEKIRALLPRGFPELAPSSPPTSPAPE